MSYEPRMKPPKPARPFMVNDVVRLARGWTPMTISYISPWGEVKAYYGLQTFDPDGERDPNVPTSSYTRPASGFTWWDGEVFPGRNLPLPRHFSVNTTGRVGQLTGYTSSGFPILEMDTSKVEIYSESEITEIKPFTFAVKWHNGSSSTHTFEDPLKRVKLNDVLVSQDGSFCTVTNIDTGANRPKPFIGRRLLTEDI